MNPRLIMLGIGVVIGYVLGTRAGREKYDAMKSIVVGYWENPRVAKARTEVQAYARQQAPVIRERAETAAKDAADKTATVAKDVAEKTATVAKDVAERTTNVAKDVAEKTVTVAKDVAEKTSTTAKDVADRTAAVAKDIAERVSETAGDVRDQALKVAGDLRERGEAAVDGLVIAAGNAREDALDGTLDEDDTEASRDK